MLALQRKSALAASLIVSSALWYAFYLFYYKWLNCFNELGRCFDSGSGVVYTEQSGIFWLLIAVLASLMTLFQLLLFSRQKPTLKSKPPSSDISDPNKKRGPKDPV